MTDISLEIKMFAESVEPNKNILDIGCGLRPYEKFFKNSKYTGIDVEISGRNEDDKKADKYYDGLNIPFPENTFDIAVCTQVIEHCVDPKVLLREILRVLKNNGVLFLTVPFMWGEHEIPYDFRRYSSYGIKKEIEDAGFKIIKLKKITTGVGAIERLVNSEIVSYKNGNDYKPDLWQKMKEFILYYLWLIVLRLWNRTYKFNRIYLDNLVIAEKINS